MRKTKKFARRNENQEKASSQLQEEVKDLYFKVGSRIMPKEAMLFQMLFDKNFSRDGKYYKGKKIKFEPLKTIKIREMKISEAKSKEKEKKEKI